MDLPGTKKLREELGYGRKSEDHDMFGIDIDKFRREFKFRGKTGLDFRRWQADRQVLDKMASSFLSEHEKRYWPIKKGTPRPNATRYVNNTS
jgi:hypothetical protein